MEWLIIFVVLVVLFVLIMTIYNGLITRKNRVKNACSHDVHKKKFDLLHLVTVRLCKAEKEFLEKLLEREIPMLVLLLRKMQ